MDHQRAFLQAIRDEPDEDAHRLVYADWLEEHAGRDGAARAAFIRAQCRLARLPEDDPARPGLEDEIEELLVEHEEEWTAPLRGVAEDYRFERGFIDRITIGGDALLTHTDALFGAMPLRAVHLGLDVGPSGIRQAKGLAACPYLASVEELLFSFLRDAALRELLQSPYLGRLTTLLLPRSDIEAPGIQALAASVLSQLTSLNLSYNRGIGDRALRLLAQTPATNNLRTLRLAGLNPTVAGFQALFESPHLLHLDTLDVGASSTQRPSIRDFSPAIKTVASSPLLGRLRHLDLSGCLPEGRGLQTLLASPLVAGLESLHLRYCQLGPEGLELLAQSPRLAGVRALDLQGNPNNALGIETLVHSPHLASLTELRLRGNRFHDTGARALASASHLTQLRILDVAMNIIGGPGIQALVAATHLTGLTELDLSANYIGPASAQALAARPGRLARLALADTGLEDDSVRILAAAPSLARLKVLDLSGNILTDASVQALAGSPHLARLEDLNLAANNLGKSAAEFLAGSPYLRRLKKLNVRDGAFTDTEQRLLQTRFGRALTL